MITFNKREERKVAEPYCKVVLGNFLGECEVNNECLTQDNLYLYHECEEKIRTTTLNVQMHIYSLLARFVKSGSALFEGKRQSK